MKVTLIAAMDSCKGIGYLNELPWSFKEDLAHFRKQTLNKTIVMGKNTFLSLKGPLSSRRNVVVSKTLKDIDGVEIFPTLDDALLASKDQEVVIMGGSSLYKEALSRDLVDELYLTMILDLYTSDVQFPEFDWNRYNISCIKVSIENNTPLVYLKGTRK